MPKAVLLALLPCALSALMLWPALLNQGVFAPTDIVANQPLIAARPPDAPMPPVANPVMGDVVDTFIPWKLLVRDQVYSGRFPLWNSYNLLGTHLHANLQSQVFSPFNLLWLMLPPLWGLGAVAALKWALAGWGAALLLRKLGVSLPAAVFGAAAFQMSGPLTAWLQWPIFEGTMWVPWATWAALGWLDTHKLKWLAALSGFVAAAWLAGHVETSFHSTAFIAVFCLAAWAAATTSLAPRERARWWTLGGLLGAGALGLALAAAQLLPFLAVLPDSYQYWVRSRVHIADVALPIQAALMWLTPNGFGGTQGYHGPMNWVEANPYAGAVTLLLAGTGLGLFVRGTARQRVSGRGIVSALSPRLPLLWALMLAVMLSMVYGIPPLGYLRELPGFSTSFNWRLVGLAGLCMAALASMAFDRLFSYQGRPVSRRWAVVLLPLAALAVGFGVFGVGTFWVTSNLDEPYMQAWRAWAGLLFCVGAALLLLRLLGWLKPAPWAMLVIALVALDVVRAGWGFNPTVPKSTFYPPSKLLTFAVERGPTERLAVVGPYVLSNMLAAYRVPEYSLYDATTDTRYFDYTRAMSPETFRTAFRNQDDSLTVHMVLMQPSTPQLSALGIKWVLTANSDDPNSWQPQPPQGPVYKRTLTKNGFTIWENTYARPYTYLAPRLHVITPEGGKTTQALALDRMRALSIPTLDVAQVEDPTRAMPSDLSSVSNKTPLSPDDTAALQSYAPGEVQVRARAAMPRFLVLSEGWEPGWRAEIDGKPAPLYRTNYLVQGVLLPAGEHTVRFVYDPPSFRWGVSVSLAALGVWLVVMAAHFVLKRREDADRQRDDG